METRERIEIIDEIGQNSEKSPEDICCHSEYSGGIPADADMKNSQELNNNNNNGKSERERKSGGGSTD